VPKSPCSGWLVTYRRSPTEKIRSGPSPTSAPDRPVAAPSHCRWTNKPKEPMEVSSSRRVWLTVESAGECIRVLLSASNASKLPDTEIPMRNRRRSSSRRRRDRVFPSAARKVRLGPTANSSPHGEAGRSSASSSTRATPGCGPESQDGDAVDSPGGFAPSAQAGTLARRSAASTGRMKRVGRMGSPKMRLWILIKL